MSLWIEGMGIAEISTVYYHDGGIVAFIQQWTGQGTLQTLTTATTILNAFYFLPMEPTTGEHYYQVSHHLGRFAAPFSTHFISGNKNTPMASGKNG